MVIKEISMSENRFYLENGDGYIGLINVAEVLKNNGWTGIAHYPKAGPAIFYNKYKIDCAADLKLQIESFCNNNEIKLKQV